ncbi:MAG: MBL fold metallo-hydrolase [Candidatus Bathyarchaeia archaeon]|jgi:glyoxylase-like metal-dependent hydrolase (beta-lactamase superfamily II)
MELFKGVHQIGVRMARATNLFMYLFTGKNPILVDTAVVGGPRDTLVPYLTEIGLSPTDLSLALITHCDPDHFGGNSELRALSPRTLLTVHDKDAEMASDPEMVMRLRLGEFRKDHDVFYSTETWNAVRAMMGSAVPIDVRLSGGEKLLVDDDLLLEVIHAPGHTRGHISIFDARDRAVFIGDAVLGRSVPDVDGKPALAPTYRYVDEYLSTIRTIRGLKPRYIYSTHFPPMEGSDAMRFLDDSEKFVGTLESEIQKMVRESRDPLPMKRMIREANARLKICPEHAELDLAFPIAGHLERLVKKKRLKTLPTSPLTYRASRARR